MAERQISLRFESKCRRCGRTLAAGEAARWNPETKWTACVRCPTSGSRTGARAPAGGVSSRSVSPSVAAVSSPWTSLVRYHLLAVQRAGVAEPPGVGDGELWRPLRLAREDVITGRADEVPLDGPLRSLYASLVPGEAVFYGWPLVVATDRSGRRRVGPLVMTELDIPLEGGPGTVVPRDDEPYLNPGLLSEGFFPADALAAVDGYVPAGLPFGDAEAMRGLVEQVVAALGFEAAVLDPDHLTPPDLSRMGVHNTAVVFRGTSNLATRALVAELTTLLDRTDWRGTAARWLLEPHASTKPAAAPTVLTPAVGAAQGGPVLDLVGGLPPVAVDGLALNDSQERALVAASRDAVTVVTGPPGTGKSQLVAAVVANQWVSGRSVLVASTNNGAVDVAARRCANLDEALLIRTGNRDQRDALPAVLEALAARGAQPGPSRAVIRRQLEAGASAREMVHGRLAQRTAVEAELAQLVLDVEALRMVIWGSPDPGPVHDRRAEIARRAVKAAGSRWGRGRDERRLLTLATPNVPGVGAGDIAAWAGAEVRADELRALLGDWGPADPARDRTELAAADAAWAAAGTSAVRDTVQEQLHTGKAALQQVARLRAAAQAARTAAVARALPHVPGWACTTLSVRQSFPLTAGLFDLLVIDEASQCSIADVLPLAYRAKRILVVGDPNQLTPVVTLTRSALEQIATGAGTTHAQMHQRALSVGQDSAYTAFAATCPTPPQLLEEHYRCHPQIARFFNEQFYAGALRILTDVATQTGNVRGLSLVEVPGRTRRGETGGAHNPEEADAVVAWVLAHLDEPGTLGVVTPFAAQAALITTRLRTALGASAWDAKNVTVGTAHRFQGDERDVMLFSTVLAADANPGTARWVEEQRNLVNVAVSRARRALVVFADTTSLAQTPVPTLHALVAMASGTADQATAAQDALIEVAALHSDAERRLFAALARRGHTPELKVVVEGYELDFALDTPTGPLDIEVDGVHHTDTRGRQRRQDLARDQILESIGWRVLRIPAWQCLAEPDRVATDVERAVGARPITSQGRHAG